MRGLDPRIHDEAAKCKSVLMCLARSLMDCRVKPGNDGGERSRHATSPVFFGRPRAGPRRIAVLRLAPEKPRARGTPRVLSDPRQAPMRRRTGAGRKKPQVRRYPWGPAYGV